MNTVIVEQVPWWDKFNEREFRKYLGEYERYAKQATGKVRTPGAFISANVQAQLEVLVDDYSADWPQQKFEAEVLPLFSPKSDLAWRVKLKGIIFKSTDQYNEEYQLYTKGCTLVAKEVAKYYVRGLPHHIKGYLPLADPSTLGEAIRQVVMSQREVDEARILLGGPSNREPKREGKQSKREDKHGYQRRFGNQGRIREEKQEKKQPVRARKEAGVCYNCGEKGHYSPDCTKPCLLCGEMGHGKHKCKKNRPSDNLKRIHDPTHTDHSQTIADPAHTDYTDVNPFDILDTLMMVQENTESNLPVVKITIRDTKVDAYVDSGATNSDFMTQRLAGELNLQIQGGKSEVEGAGGKVKVLGTVETVITHEDERYPREFKVLKEIPGRQQVILGWRWLKLRHVKKQVKQMMEARATLFSGELADQPAKVPAFEIETKDYSPKPVPRRYFKPVVEKLVEIQVQEWLQKGVIVPYVGPHASPIVPVVKEKINGIPAKIRLCIDFKATINDYTALQKYPIPEIKDLWNRLRGKACYIQVDMLSGFLQIPLKPEHQPATAFITRTGHYMFTRMPFGLKNAATYFQNIMAVTLQTFRDNVVIYIDDIIIFADTYDELLSVTQRVFDHLARLNFRIKPTKVTVSDQVLFCGLVVSAGGLRISSERYDTVRNMVPPRTLKECRSVLGFFNWFRSFIPNHSVVAAPLTALTKTKKGDKSRFVLTKEAAAAFEQLKQALLRAPMLHHFDTRRPTAVFTDASDVGAGAVLLQAEPSSNPHWVFPIAFFSRKFTTHQQTWTVIQKECCAIFLAVSTWYRWLCAAPFRIYTDHNNLRWWAQAANPMLQRWYALLMGLDFQVVHTPGGKNEAADHLSRFPEAMVVSDQFLFLDDGEDESEVHEDDPPDDAAATPQEGGPSSGGGVEVRPTWSPEQLTIMQAQHNAITGHCGVQELSRRIADSDSDVQIPLRMITDFVKSCPVCQKSRITSRWEQIEAPKFTTKASDPLEQLRLDHITGLPEDEEGNQNILVITLPSIRYVFLFGTKTVDAREAYKAILEVTGMIGVPRAFRSDRGGAFDSALVEAVAYAVGNIRVLSDSYIHEQNGLIETVHRQVLRHLRALVFEIDVVNEWSTVLPIVARIINLTPHRDLGNLTPASLLFGFMSPTSMRMLPPTKDEERLSERFLRIYRIQERMIEKTLRNQSQPHGPSPPQAYKNGSLVLMKDDRRPKGNKVQMPWKGPYKVVGYNKILGVYTLHSTAGATNSDTIKVHVSFLRPYNAAQTPDPVAVHAKDFNHQGIDKIIAHRGNPRRRKAMTFNGRFLDGGEEIKSYMEVRQTEALDRYILENKESSPDLQILLKEE